MKVRKEISLTPQTYEIAARMPNFSQWVRISLRAYDMQEDVGSEMMLRIRWARAARHLASALCEYAVMVDPEFNLTPDDLIAKAMNQTSLDDYDENLS